MSSITSVLRSRASGLVPTPAARLCIAADVFGSMSLAEIKRLARVHTAAICSLSIDVVQQRYLLSAGADKSIQLFDLESPSRARHGTRQIESSRCIAAGGGHTSLVSSVEWYPIDSGMFSSASFDHTLRVWDTSTMAEVCQFDLGSRIYCQKMSLTGAHALIAVASESPYIRLCDLRTGASSQQLQAHRGGGTVAAWSPIQPYILATGGNDGKLKLWDIRQARSHIGDFGHSMDGSPCAHSSGLNGLLFTNDGEGLISSGSDQHIRVWSIESPPSAMGDFPSTGAGIYGATGISEMATTTAADGTSGSDVLFRPCGDTTVSVASPSTGQQLALLDGHFAATHCAAWRSNSKELYTAGADSNIIIWSIPAREELSRDQEELRADSWSDSEPQDAP
ncbi:DNA excision repair protein ERCC-8 [Coemansia sp. RSA 552]|nr:DNA excision repair protein ERCC-8 [Coemansia sp. RSA 552]